ncbi:MAG TPA: ParB/RepB/Spo0J family partition protein [Desulfitobacteriaceae bacterium]|nr:ParB/RepB/Spo0J family partition protein [Desulfitobacteriaceae bacterium]
MSKRALGRGLDALIFDSSTDMGFKEIALTEIETNLNQPRREFDPENLAELAESLRTHGLLQPILVREDGDRYIIIAGERRYRAAKMAGFEKIACLVQECSQQESAERALVENIQRAELSAVDEGLAYQRLMEEYGLTQEQVAQRVGKGRPTIANLLRVIKLPEPVLSLLCREEITLGHAKLLLSVEDTSLQVIVAKKIAQERLSVREAEIVLKRLTDRDAQERDEDEIRPEKAIIDRKNAMLDIEEKLNSYFQTKVKLQGGDKKGKIVIEYFSQDELNRILELWNIIVD